MLCEIKKSESFDRNCVVPAFILDERDVKEKKKYSLFKVDGDRAAAKGPSQSESSNGRSYTSPIRRQKLHLQCLGAQAKSIEFGKFESRFLV